MNTFRTTALAFVHGGTKVDITINVKKKRHH
jgi:hypothetical protein